MRCSSCQRSAVDSPALDALELGLRRLELLAGARVVDLLRVDGVVDERDRAVELDLEEAGAGRELEHLVAVDARCTRVEPALSVATSGACRASTPISPAAPGTISISASPSNAAPVGRDERDVERLPVAVGHATLRSAPAASLLALRSTASSIVPTM